MAAQQVFKLRPVIKSKEEQEAEKNLYFELPRKNCEQISPFIKRLEQIPKAAVAQHKWHLFKKMLRKAGYKSIDTSILPYLQAVDKSDQIKMDGEVSKRMYQDLLNSREFNLYGQQVRPVKQAPRKHLELKFLASKMGIEYTQEVDNWAEDVRDPDEDEIHKMREIKIKKITTEKWKIGHPEVFNPPVGFASNPREPYNSLGNEYYFSYDGHWKNGRMNGQGTYLFEDGFTYEGYFKDNKVHGTGKSEYPGGRSYDGEWQNSKFQGRGLYENKDGLRYEGEYYFGKRNGTGKVSYPSGMTYEGEFLDGKPHGRGKIMSFLSGWGYDGNFEK